MSEFYNIVVQINAVKRKIRLCHLSERRGPGLKAFLRNGQPKTTLELSGPTKSKSDRVVPLMTVRLKRRFSGNRVEPREITSRLWYMPGMGGFFGD